MTDYSCVAQRRLPNELVASLRALRALEAATDGREQRARVVVAVSRLMLAAIEQGWQQQEVARAAGLKRSTAQKRVAAIKELGMTGAGLDVPAAPQRPKQPPESRLAQERRLPPSEREWLTFAEAVAYIGGNDNRLRIWRRQGFLPHTRAVAPCWFIYLKSDLDRVMRAPLHRGLGHRIDHAGLHALIALETKQAQLAATRHVRPEDGRTPGA